jgi:hypothetical protein
MSERISIQPRDVVSREPRHGRTIEYLTNGNVRINGLELAPPDDWWSRWTMRDVHGNLLIGSTRPGTKAVLILRDPTLAEARTELHRVAKELEKSAEAPDYPAAFSMALERLPLHAKVYTAA